MAVLSMTPEQWGLTILAAAETPNFLSGLLPSKMTIARFAAHEQDVANLRRGELVASALSLGVGLGASLIARSPIPFLACAAVLAVLLYEYEDAIRHPHPSQVAIDAQGF